jgi:hypothetical protein
MVDHMTVIHQSKFRMMLMLRQVPTVICHPAIAAQRLHWQYTASATAEHCHTLMFQLKGPMRLVHFNSIYHYRGSLCDVMTHDLRSLLSSRMLCALCQIVHLVETLSYSLVSNDMSLHISKILLKSMKTTSHVSDLVYIHSHNHIPALFSSFVERDETIGTDSGLP